MKGISSHWERMPRKCFVTKFLLRTITTCESEWLIKKEKLLLHKVKRTSISLELCSPNSYATSIFVKESVGINEKQGNCNSSVFTKRCCHLTDQSVSRSTKLRCSCNNGITFYPCNGVVNYSGKPNQLSRYIKPKSSSS